MGKIQQGNQQDDFLALLPGSKDDDEIYGFKPGQGRLPQVPAIWPFASEDEDEDKTKEALVDGDNGAAVMMICNYVSLIGN